MNIIYNDFKENDILANIVYLKGRGFVVNNFLPSAACVKRLNIFCDRAYISIKLIHDNFDDQARAARDQGFKHIAVDAENYLFATQPDKIKYTRALGSDLREFLKELGYETIAVLPEDLGGAKYKNYNEFLKGIRPDVLLMERLYNQTEWYNIGFYYLKSLWLRLRGAEIFIGIWPEKIPEARIEAQEKAAKFFSGDRIFWYSETKSLPKYE